ncbi:CHAT domain-containing protein [Dolichospermum sp. UHCC 0259]|uniref:CHAT domain-containing protein n=1 Tax=Dolichospermum sp. UHCC 0259 TaxID=2590010 RepID=UPI001447A780|nr:CHAT domain-containing protein [Dolichospermum sp. UHCC 0259]MTJ48856.1 CHAT domain-containing protein [Dolichospermum sp. UHCC 0259]
MFHHKSRKIITFCLLITLVFLSTITFSIILQNQSAIATEDIDWNRLIKDKNFAETVHKVEKRWEKEYEDYFSQNLADFSLKAEDIAKTLTKLSQETATKPAVIWVYPVKKQLQLLIITSGKKPKLYSIKDANQATLTEVVKKLKSEVTQPTNPTAKSYLKPAQKLYNWIIKPLESTLKSEKIDTLIFCLGSGLRTIPLVTLHDGEKFLIEKYSITRIPAFNLLKTDYNPIKNAQILAMGASTFSQLESLPAVPLELDEITKIWAGKRFINQQFTIKNLQQQRQKQHFRIIHLATHAEFKPGKPNQSYIQLWGNEKIRLNEIEKLKLDQPPVDLLVLSACKTALGDQEAELGFAGLTVKSGVKSVLASLWNVSDLGTMALMIEFYENLQKIPLKAEALRQAQIAMLTGKVTMESGKLQGSRGDLPLPSELAKLADANFSHPFYWSAFTMIGNPW